MLKSFTVTFNPDGALTAGLDVEAGAGVGRQRRARSRTSAISSWPSARRPGTTASASSSWWTRSSSCSRPTSRRSSSRCTGAPAGRCRSRWSAPGCRRSPGSPARPSRTASGCSASRRSATSTLRRRPRRACRARRVSWARVRRPTPSTSSSSTRRATPTSSRSTGASSGTRPPASPVDARRRRGRCFRWSRRSSTRASSGCASNAPPSWSCAICMRWRELGSAPQRASEVAQRVGTTAQQAGPIRSRLIDKGLLYTPELRLRGVHGAAVRHVHAAASRRSRRLLGDRAVAEAVD